MIALCLLLAAQSLEWPRITATPPGSSMLALLEFDGRSVRVTPMAQPVSERAFHSFHVRRAAPLSFERKDVWCVDGARVVAQAVIHTAKGSSYLTVTTSSIPAGSIGPAPQPVELWRFDCPGGSGVQLPRWVDLAQIQEVELLVSNEAGR